MRYITTCAFLIFCVTAMASDGDDRADSRLAWAICGSLEQWIGRDVRLDASEVESAEWDKVESDDLGRWP